MGGVVDHGGVLPAPGWQESEEAAVRSQNPRTTLSDVARVAGVSVATASRVLADRGDFAPGTRLRVLGAAESLRYSRARTRQGRPVVRATSVDLVVGRVSSAWTDRAISGAWRAASRHGVGLNLVSESTCDAEQWAAQLARRRSGGAVFGLVQPLASELAELARAHLPVVLLDPLSEPQADVASIGAANWAGGYAAGRHLVERGAHRFVSVVARPAYRFAAARAAGFAAAVAGERPGAPLETLSTSWDGPGPIPGLTRMLRGGPGPTGVFASNDHLALRCYPAVRAAGLTVGRDVLVVGFDDEPRAGTCSPPLTSVHQPVEAIASEAVELLLAAVRGDDAPEHLRIELPVRLVPRASTGVV